MDYAVHFRLPDVEEPDHMSDLFALASTMYEMVYVEVPYSDLGYVGIWGQQYRSSYSILDDLVMARLSLVYHNGLY